MWFGTVCRLGILWRVLEHALADKGDYLLNVGRECRGAMKSGMWMCFICTSHNVDTVVQSLIKYLKQIELNIQ